MKTYIKTEIKDEFKTMNKTHLNELEERDEIRKDLQAGENPNIGKLSPVNGIGIAPIGYFVARDMRSPSPQVARSMVFPFNLSDHPFEWIRSFRRRRNPETSSV